MKKLLLTLVVALAFGGSIFAQQTHWPEFNLYQYNYNLPLVAFVQIGGEFVTVDNYTNFEIAAFVGDECRGHMFMDDYTDYGDPYPIVEMRYYYNNIGDTVTFQMYDHSTGNLYETCTTNMEVLTGESHDELYFDYDEALVLNFFLGTTISATANPMAGGIVTGTGNYGIGDVCTLSASANPGYYFLNWSENGIVVSTDAEYSFTVTESRNLVANFYTRMTHWPEFNYQQYQQYQFNLPLVAFVQIGGEYVTVDNYTNFEIAAFVGDECRGHMFMDDYTDEGDPYPIVEMSYYYNNIGDTVTFQMYDHSTGNLYETCITNMEVLTGEDHVELYFDYDEALVLNFFLGTTISATANPMAGGIVTGTGNYGIGDVCTLSALANPGYYFLNWSENGIVVSTDAEYSFTVTENRNLVANFNTNHWTTHWPEFNMYQYQFNLPVVGFVQIDGEYITSANYANMEIGAFVNGECRGHMFMTDYTEDGDPYPIVEINYHYTNTGDLVTFQLYDHSTGTLYETCITNMEVLTGETHVELYFDYDDALILNFFVPTTISATANPMEGGIVTGTGNYRIGDVCTLSASANPGYYFLNWSENGIVVSTDAEYSFTVTESRNLVANFYTNHWTTESFQSSMFMVGVVMIDSIEQTSPTLELGAFCNGECRGSEFPTYYEGRWLYYMNIGGYSGDSITFRLYDHSLQQEVNLFCFSEIPFESYGLIGMDDPYEVLFGKMSVVSVIVNPADAGIVTGSGNYLNGTEVTLTASSNSTFVNWTIGDEQVSTDTIYSFIVVEDVTVVANFLPRYEVTVSASPVEGGFISGAGIFDHGTSCTLVATAYDGYAFVNWSINDEIVSTESSYTFTITAPVDITANFGVLCPVSVFVSPEVAGTISGAGEYLFGTSVTLIATANEGYQFNSWAIDGEIVSTEASYTFTVTAPVSLTANFDLLCSVSADVNLEGAGTVTGEGEYLYGTDATLTATANAGYAFNNWTLEGEVVSTEPTYTFTVTAPMSLMANFNAVHMQQLVQGYNWFSTFVEISLDDLKAALVAALPGTTITINSQSDGSTTYNGARWRGSMNSLDLSQMYMVNVTADCEMTVEGLPIDPSEHVATIHPNFNWMAFPLRQSMTLTNAFAGFVVNGDMVISQSEGSSTYFNQWRGWLSTFEPGKGYMYKSNVQGDRTFTFPIITK